MTGRAGMPAMDLVREYWMANRLEADFEAWWRRTLHDGVAAGTQSPARAVTLDAAAVRAAAAALPASRDHDLHVALRPDPNIGDGSHANNGWLQELPKPWSKLTWDNAALLSPRLAAELEVENGDVVRLRTTAGEVEAPVWVLPGHADRCVTVHLGYGRRRSGRIGNGAGFDAYRLHASDAGWDAPVTIERTGRRATLVSTQEHHSMEGRDLVRVAGTGDGDAHAEAAHGDGHGDLTLYPPHPYDGYSWGMSIDLGACSGCNACVVACNAENNIPIVGKDQVRRGREMHWIRIDRYFDGDPEAPDVHHQPVLCMHCENAPCEVVCPVAATSHGPEGTNDMTYNRCVGTRYCSNNCPYKVRRFNYYQYADTETPVLDLMRNPDVTVRTRGVMEKCTYCIQRVNLARQDAKVEGRTLRDGDVVTACQQACPSEAIVFGDINDPTSRISRRRHDPRHYALLHELNTRPRTTYLARSRNPNPELESL
jgi:molybdopterin-containing oxidoreductase family iron-sulfur binding subunit